MGRGGGGSAVVVSELVGGSRSGLVRSWVARLRSVLCNVSVRGGGGSSSEREVIMKERSGQTDEKPKEAVQNVREHQRIL